MLRTMRGRLIAGLVTLLAVACALIGVTTYLAVRNSLSRGVGTQLQNATNLWYACQDHHMNDGDADDGVRPSGGDHGSSWHAAAGMPPLSDCPGLATGTLRGYVMRGQLNVDLLDHPDTLSTGDKRTLLQLPVTPLQPGQSPRTYTRATRTLGSLGGDYELTAIQDPDDATTYITGVSLAGTNDTLHDLALAELVIFASVLLLTGAGGTLWVRLSLRPLRRVAATATAVAELPLESGEVELPAGVPYTDPGTETGQVGAAFNQMLGHVEQALVRRAASEARLRRFAADASHELRTPLAAIRGYAELALRHPDEPPEVVTHALNRVLSESTQMSVLVDDLLLLARLDAGRPLSREPADMSRLAIDATSDSRVARPDHRWVLELPDDPVMVNGDELRLHQVLTNLLGNAGRHTPEGTTVTVRLSASAEPHQDPPWGAGSVLRGVVPPDPRMILTVTDDGPGIPPDLLPDLFERFTRADTSRSHVADASSTGLGLAIVDAVVAAHHGAIVVTSRPGLTRFAIVLPRIAEPATGPDAAVPAGPRRARKSLHRLLG
jgi:two-component system, OmpR family, sensor kinase